MPALRKLGQARPHLVLLALARRLTFRWSRILSLRAAKVAIRFRRQLFGRPLGQLRSDDTVQGRNDESINYETEKKGDMPCRRKWKPQVRQKLAEHIAWKYSLGGGLDQEPGTIHSSTDSNPQDLDATDRSQRPHLPSLNQGRPQDHRTAKIGLGI